MIKHYTATVVDKDGKTSKYGYNANDDGSHTDGISIAVSINGESNAGFVSLHASETVDITVTQPDLSSVSVNKKTKLSYLVTSEDIDTNILITISDCKDVIVNQSAPVVRAIVDPLGIHDLLKTKSGASAINTVKWAKYMYKIPKLN